VPGQSQPPRLPPRAPPSGRGGRRRPGGAGALDRALPGQARSHPGATASRGARGRAQRGSRPCTGGVAGLHRRRLSAAGGLADPVGVGRPAPGGGRSRRAHRQSTGRKPVLRPGPGPGGRLLLPARSPGWRPALLNHQQPDPVRRGLSPRWRLRPHLHHSRGSGPVRSLAGDGPTPRLRDRRGGRPRPPADPGELLPAVLRLRARGLPLLAQGGPRGAARERRPALLSRGCAALPVGPAPAQGPGHDRPADGLAAGQHSRLPVGVGLRRAGGQAYRVRRPAPAVDGTDRRGRDPCRCDRARGPPVGGACAPGLLPRRAGAGGGRAGGRGPG
jgi:hypothetical protein